MAPTPKGSVERTEREGRTPHYGEVHGTVPFTSSLTKASKERIRVYERAVADKKDEPMPVVSVRVPVSLAQRLEAIVEELDALVPHAFGSVSKSEVRRRALERGVEQLEREVAALKGDQGEE